MILTPINLAIILLTVIAIVAVIGWLFRKDDAIEDRRRRMLILYARLRELGLDDFAGAAEAYVIGDYSGLYAKGQLLLEVLMDPVKADAMLAKHFYLQLASRVKDPSDLLKIKAALAEPK